jgi:hypothetical protein
MEVTLKAGDSLNIPEGCKAVIKDNVVVFEREEKEDMREFKDGDVLHSTYDSVVLIFKDYTDSTYFSSHYNCSGVGNNMWRICCFRHATEEEKQLLFNKMKEQGLQWNAEEKRVETIRWRAKKGEYYYHINADGFASTIKHTDYITDYYRYNFGNYFRTKEQTKEAARRVREALRQYHEEIGE